MSFEELVASIHAQIRRVRESRAQAAQNPDAVKPRRALGTEVRARLAQAQKMRWARQKKKGKAA